MDIRSSQHNPKRGIGGLIGSRKERAMGEDKDIWDVIKDKTKFDIEKSNPETPAELPKSCWVFMKCILTLKL
jgi:hypothetical protein